MTIPYNTDLPPDLRALKEEIEGYARDYGLDFYETIFEVLDAEDLNEVAAYGGFPTRYPHWSFGMSYEELRKGYDYGLSKIYEMVINNDPCYAYLMRCNLTVDQKLVMAHVYGHCDFFKNNAYFAHTNRKMMDEMANHGARIRHYAEKFGEDEVEGFLDRCMSVEDLIDIHSTAIKRRRDVPRSVMEGKEEDDETIKLTRFKSKGYMDDFINPREVLKAEEERLKKEKEKIQKSFPEQQEKDVLLFLIEHAPLKPWQRDVLSIVRDEAYYFSPQGQTKILNEGWACTVAGTNIFTDRGLLKIEDIVERRKPVRVSDGQSSRLVYDWVKFSDRETVWVRTRRGFELEGSLTHRVLLADGSWKPLGEIQIGHRVSVAGGGLWPKKKGRISWEPRRRLSLTEIAVETGLSVSQLRSYRYGQDKPTEERVVQLLAQYDAGLATLSRMQNRRRPIRVPKSVDEKLAAFLGYLIGDGHISKVKRTIGLTTGDDEQVERFAELTETLFGIRPRRQREGGKWRVKFSSADLEEFLMHLGLKTGFCARVKEVPEAILRSPKPVVAAFLRAYYDCDGYAGNGGVILSTSSVTMSKTVQLLLLNFGILSTRRLQKDGCWHVQTLGRSAETFLREIGFGLPRKQEALRKYVEDRHWFLEQPWHDEIVAVERRRADVYDISVEQTHRYAAQGFVNHNSYWHSTIMTQKALQPSEVIDYADHHSGTVATQRARINPYKLGLELLRDIEHRWNTGKFGKEYEECEDLEKRRAWDKQLGLGRQKIFEVRRVHNDISFIDTFLTPEFCVEHKMFSFNYQQELGQYVIESREFEKIKRRLLFSLTNFGKPFIYVVDGNFRNRGELLLRHQYNGVDLRLDRAADTLANLQFIWNRPVHLETVVDNKPTMLSFDGSEHTSKNLGEPDEPKKPSAGKTK